MKREGVSVHRVRFGIFLADIQARELYRRNARVRIQNQAFQVLALLLERPGDVVTREELQNNIWPEGTFVDFEEGLNASVRKLRAALGDSAENPRFIETLPRVGYRFIAPVVPDLAPEEAALVDPGSHAAESPPEQSPPRSRWKNRLRWAAAGIAACAILLAAAAFLMRQPRRVTGGAPPAAINSIAVLPLENLSRDPDLEYFSDGLTDELITDLAQRIKGRVISRTSVMHYKRTVKSVPQVARELGVDAIVEGTVESAGGRVRIHAKLIQGASDQTIWASSYDRDLRDILLLQSEVARDIASRIRLNLAAKSPAGAANLHPVNPVAYRNYLKGLYYWNQWSIEGVSKSLDYFQTSINIDPAYAPPHAGLALSLSWLCMMGKMPPGEAYPRVRAEAMQSLSLDPKLARGHTALAEYVLFYKWDPVAAEAEYQRAAELNPSDTVALDGKSTLPLLMGRQDEALVGARQALAVDPSSESTRGIMAYLLYLTHEYDNAIAHLRDSLDIYPNSANLRFILADCYERKGMYREAVTEDLKAFELTGVPPATLARLRSAFERSGIRGYWREQVRFWRESDAANNSVNLASVYASLGDSEKALEWLYRAYQEHSVPLVIRIRDPHFDSLRGDARFRELARRLGFPP